MCSDRVAAAAQAAPQPVLEVRGISKRYDSFASPAARLWHILRPDSRHGPQDFWALRDVDVTLYPGDTVAIVGKNGSGKSTLLQIISGTLSPTDGSVELRGRVAALLELGAGFNPEFTGRENVFLNGALLGASDADMAARFAEIEAFAEIGDFIDQPVKTYSSGMYVRLAFSVAIHTRPQILIVDEALSVGDSRFQAKCLNRIKQLQQQGVTILFVSHDVGAVRTLCKKAIWLDGGRVRMAGDAFAVTAQYNQYLFEGDVAQQPPAEPVAALPAAHPDEVAAGDDPQPPAPAAVTDADDAATQLFRQRPVNHWGSHMGAIREAVLLDAHGRLSESLEAMTPVTVRIRFTVPERADRSTLSAAFSLKDLAGTDLVVSTTWEQYPQGLPVDGDEAVVTFSFLNRLNAGKYLLAVALEDRAGVYPQYYEYIEGAQYFSSTTRSRLFGNFLVDVEQRCSAVLPASSSASPT